MKTLHGDELIEDVCSYLTYGAISIFSFTEQKESPQT